MGISYGGISQLFTAQLRPPSLAAISPLSVIDATQTTLYPGGILNTGFARQLGQGARPRRPAGVGRAAASRGRTSGSRRATRPARPTRRCTARRSTCWRRSAPTTTTCRRWPTRWRRSRSSTRSTCRPTWPASGPTSRPAATARRWPSTSAAPSRKWFTFTNGTHVDSLDPETFNRWYDFLELYVAQEAPSTNAATIRAGGAGDLQGGDGDRRRDAAARPDPGAAHLRRRAGRVRAAAADPHPVRQRRRRLVARPSAARLRAVVQPLPGARDARRGSGTSRKRGGLGKKPKAQARRRRLPLEPARAAADRLHAATRRPARTGCGRRRRPTAGRRTRPAPRSSYVTAPLRATTTVIGAGAVHAWIRSSTRNVDLQATISEVRPDGKETFVQGGWLRGQRAQARPPQEPQARAGPEPAQARRQAAAAQALREGHDPALLPGPRLPLRARGSASRSARPTATSRSGRSGRRRRAKRAKIEIARSKKQASNLLLPVVGRAGLRPACRRARASAASRAATTGATRTGPRSASAERGVSSGGMNAVTFDALDTPPRARDDLDAPVAGSGQVLVRVRASSANPVDNAIAAGMLAQMVEHDFPVTLGRDYAGVVEAVGDGVERLRGRRRGVRLPHPRESGRARRLVGRADRRRRGAVDRQSRRRASTSRPPAPPRSRASRRWRASTRSTRSRASAC